MSVEVSESVPFVSQGRFLRGAGFVVVHAETGDIKTQIDVGTRVGTNRTGGEISVSFETRKPKETHRENVLGAFPEMFNDDTLERVGGDLLTSDGLRSTPDLFFDNEGRPVAYALAVVVFTGSKKEPFRSYNRSESHPYRWMSPEDFLRRTDTRPLARHAVGHLVDTGLIKRKIEEVLDPARPSDRAVPEGFSLNAFYGLREQKRDMIPGRVYRLA